MIGPEVSVLEFLYYANHTTGTSAAPAGWIWQPLKYPLSEAIESRFPIAPAASWTSARWHWSYYASALYVVAMVIGLRIMRHRPALELKWALVFWNSFLALFSVAGAAVMVPLSVTQVLNAGITGLVCDLVPSHRDRYAIWAVLFVWSKVWEFGDTAFLVLRKKRVIHLHWIHHTLTCVLAAISMSKVEAFGTQIMAINFSIHGVMYAYYAARAAGAKVPLAVAQWITRSQIMQMVWNLVTLIHVVVVMNWSPRLCHNSPSRVYPLVGLFTLFTALFVNFFVESYKKRGQRS